MFDIFNSREIREKQIAKYSLIFNNETNSLKNSKIFLNHC